MDPVKILKRAWHILWSYRTLWIFGLILALTASGSSGGSGNNGARYSGDSSNQQYENFAPKDLQEGLNEAGEELGRVFEEGLPAAGISQEEITALLWIAGLFILVMIVIGILMTFARYTSETAVIRMVDEYEATDTKMTFREGWRTGWSRTSWRLFLINLIVNLPVILLLIFLGITGYVIYTIFSTGGSESFAVAGTVSIVAIVILVLFVVMLVSVVLYLLRHFFWRACALEELGVRDSLRRGYQMVRENWKNVGIMWLVMIGLGIAWFLLSFIAIIITIPILLITIVVGAVVAAIPGLLLVGFFSIFLSGYLPWIAGGIFILPLFFTLAFSPWIMLTAWQQVYTSTVWTLVYREIKALPTLAPEIEIEPIID